MPLRYFEALLMIGLFLWVAPPATAQTITITDFRQSTDAPGTYGSVTVKEGDDYFKQVLGNPFDGNDRRDSQWEENCVGSSVGVTNGIWKATNNLAGRGYFFPLFGGYAGALTAEGLPGDKTLPRIGYKHPILASKYTLLSFSMNHSARGTLAVYWKTKPTNPTDSRWPDGSQYGARYDGYYDYTRGYLNSGFTIYSIDMTALSSFFEQMRGSWTGQIAALRVSPSAFSGAGAQMQFDWMRLSDPASAPLLTITWNSDNLSANNLVTLWADTDASDFNGQPLARFPIGRGSGNGISYTFPTSLLPNGQYYFYLTSQTVPNGAEAWTAYSPALTIGFAPGVTISAPSAISGSDYFTANGNPADMSSASDVPNLNTAVWPSVWRQFTNPQFINGVFQIDADPPWTQIGNTESDVQVHLNVSPSTPIDTSRYRYLVYRMALDRTNYASLTDGVRDGWVSRPVFWNQNVLTGATFKAHMVYEGYHSYVVDLWGSSADTLENGTPYTQNATFSHFRIDPNENTRATSLRTWIDDVKLLTEPQARTGTYNIQWSIFDRDDSTFSAALYYSTKATGSSPHLIANLSNLQKGANNYVWDTSQLANGSRYFIRIDLTDSQQTVTTVSSVPLVIGTPTVAPRRRPPSYDYDGDGRSDPVVFRPGTKGKFYVNQSTLGVTQSTWGKAADVPIQGDFDGDGIADIASIRPNSSNILHWYIRYSSSGITADKPWGKTGDEVVPGDYNGNGIDDIAVFRNGAWVIRYDSGASEIRYWGSAGDKPVPRDYDGDGKTDLAIWRWRGGTGDGKWRILYSGYATGASAKSSESFLWGQAATDLVVPADYDGDGRADIAIWRPSNGNWYVRFINGTKKGTTRTVQWGLPSDIPISRMDRNGDGKNDYVVWRPSSGTWYFNPYSSAVSAVQFGLPGDRVPR